MEKTTSTIAIGALVALVGAGALYFATRPAPVSDVEKRLICDQSAEYIKDIASRFNLAVPDSVPADRMKDDLAQKKISDLTYKVGMKLLGKRDIIAAVPDGQVMIGGKAFSTNKPRGEAGWKLGLEMCVSML